MKIKDWCIMKIVVDVMGGDYVLKEIVLGVMKVVV